MHDRELVAREGPVGEHVHDVEAEHAATLAPDVPRLGSRVGALGLPGVSTSPTRVFVGRLSGLQVFDPAGDQVGRVRDLVA